MTGQADPPFVPAGVSLVATDCSWFYQPPRLGVWAYVVADGRTGWGYRPAVTGVSPGAVTAVLELTAVIEAVRALPDAALHVLVDVPYLPSWAAGVWQPRRGSELAAVLRPLRAEYAALIGGRNVLLRHARRHRLHRQAHELAHQHGRCAPLAESSPE